MGRPKKKPTIKVRPLAGGRCSFLVTATVGGKQMKKVCGDMETAKAVAAKWRGADLASLNYFPTSLTIQELRAAEAWIAQCRALNEEPKKITLWTAQNYKKPGIDRWDDVIEQFRQSRRRKHRLKGDAPDTPHIGNLISAVKSFASHVGREQVGSPSLEEVEAWLTTRGGMSQLLGDFRSFCIWCVKRGKMPSDPTAAIEREVKERGKLPTVLRPEEAAISHIRIPDVPQRFGRFTDRY